MSSRTSLDAAEKAESFSTQKQVAEDLTLSPEPPSFESPVSKKGRRAGLLALFCLSMFIDGKLNIL